MQTYFTLTIPPPRAWSGRRIFYPKRLSRDVDRRAECCRAWEKNSQLTVKHVLSLDAHIYPFENSNVLCMFWSCMFGAIFRKPIKINVRAYVNPGLGKWPNVLSGQGLINRLVNLVICWNHFGTKTASISLRIRIHRQHFFDKRLQPFEGVCKHLKLFVSSCLYCKYVNVCYNYPRLFKTYGCHFFTTVILKYCISIMIAIIILLVIPLFVFFFVGRVDYTICVSALSYSTTNRNFVNTLLHKSLEIDVQT